MSRNMEYKQRIADALMVLTGVGQYAYRREDGVYVVPIGCLHQKSARTLQRKHISSKNCCNFAAKIM